MLAMVGSIWHHSCTGIWLFSLSGSFQVSIFTHSWLFILGGGYKIIARKFVFDQFIIGPMLVHWTLFVIGLINGKTVIEASDNARSNLLNTMKYSYSIWPMVALLNFSVIPVYLRVLHVNIVSLFWNWFLSYTSAPKTKAGVDPDYIV